MKLPAADGRRERDGLVRVGGLRDARRLELTVTLADEPAVNVQAVVKTAVVGDHVENPCHAVVNAAPSRAVAHHAGAQASPRLMPLSWIAAASRSSSAPVWE